jgi:hypothetical protein
LKKNGGKCPVSMFIVSLLVQLYCTLGSPPLLQASLPHFLCGFDRSEAAARCVAIPSKKNKKKLEAKGLLRCKCLCLTFSVFNRSAATAAAKCGDSISGASKVEKGIRPTFLKLFLSRMFICAFL